MLRREFFTAVSGLALLVSSASAVQINLNFASNRGDVGAAETAGVVKPVPNFYNNVAFPTVAVADLIDSNNGATGADLTITGLAGDQGAFNMASTGNDYDMMAGHIYSAGVNPLTIALTDLPAGPKDIYVYFNAGSHPYEQTFTLNGGSPVSVTDFPGASPFAGTYVQATGSLATGNYVLFSGVTGTSVTIATQGTGNAEPALGGGSQYGYMSGMQIVEVPEPSSIILLGLGAMGLLARRRRRR